MGGQHSLTRRARAGGLALAALATLALTIAVGIGHARWGPRACAPSSGTDRAKRLAELREIEARNWQLAPRFSYWDAEGCDVCPELCFHLDLRLIPLPELAREYERLLAVPWDDQKHSFALEGIFDRLRQLTCIAIRHGPEGERAILRFLDAEDELARFRAAAMAIDLGLANEKPLRIMRAIYEKGGRLWANAFAQISRWENHWLRGIEPPPYRKRMFDRP